jgi:hypothetical protein
MRILYLMMGRLSKKSRNIWRKLSENSLAFLRTKAIKTTSTRITETSKGVKIKQQLANIDNLLCCNIMTVGKVKNIKV